jgi:hypothetical protein
VPGIAGSCGTAGRRRGVLAAAARAGTARQSSACTAAAVRPAAAANIVRGALTTPKNRQKRRVDLSPTPRRLAPDETPASGGVAPAWSTATGCGVCVGVRHTTR